MDILNDKFIAVAKSLTDKSDALKVCDIFESDSRRFVRAFEEEDEAKRR
ncbi:MAG: hypothetical protein ACI4QE_00830 [Acutalibacteraceae bacterium]